MKKATVYIKMITFDPPRAMIRLNGEQTIEIMKKNPEIFKFERESSRYSYFSIDGDCSEAEKLIKLAWVQERMMQR